MTDDDLPPTIHDRETLDELPASDSEPPPPIIPAGFAQHAMSATLSDLARAYEMVEATAMALARQLDAQATE